MNPNGVLEVDDIMLLVDKLQHYEKEDLANRLSQYRTTAKDDDDDVDIDDANDAVEYFGAHDLLAEMDHDDIVEYLEDLGYKVKES